MNWVLSLTRLGCVLGWWSRQYYLFSPVNFTFNYNYNLYHLQQHALAYDNYNSREGVTNYNSREGNYTI